MMGTDDDEEESKTEEQQVQQQETSATMTDPLTTMIYVKPPKYTGHMDDWLDWEGRMFCCLAQNGCGKALIERTTPIKVMTMTEQGTYDKTDADEVARY
jgi:hypothetical protein